MNAIVPYNFPLQVAWRVMNLLVERKAILNDTGTIFYCWPRGDRIVVAFDPSAIDTARINEDFAHRLSTRMHGRLVVRTNSRGIFLQIGFSVPAAPMPLEARPLDLKAQPGPYHMPIGMTKEGPLWISLIDGDSFLVGGSRRMGKSGLTHGMIQALLHGGQTDVYAWDGKGGLEYQAYIGRPNFHFISNAERGLTNLTSILEQRLQQLKTSGYVNIIKHNEAGEEPIRPIALFVDEIALLEDHVKEMLKRMVEYYGAAGLYSVLATNNPTQAAILVKSNLSTRICLPVPSFNDSLTVLGMKGAEALQQKGRGLIVWDGRAIEFQTFQVTYPTPTEEQRQLLAEQLTSGDVRVPESHPDEIVQMAERIRDLWRPGMSKSEVSRLLGKNYAGSSWTQKVNRVIEFLNSTTTPGTPPDSGAIPA